MNRPGSPFWKCLNTTLPAGDIRRDILEYLSKSLAGIFPPLSGYNKKLLWVEIGLILPGIGKGKDDKKGMVWICVPKQSITVEQNAPNSSKKNNNDFVSNYQDALSKLFPGNSSGDTQVKELKFSCHKLTLVMCCQDNRKDNVLKELMGSPFLCIPHDKDSLEKYNGSQEQTCESNCSCSADCLKQIKELLECSCKDIGDLAKLPRIISSKADLCTYFPLMRPGSFFIGDNRSGNAIIGAVAVFWQETPTEEEVLFLKRTIINTLWIELMGHYDFFQYQGIMAAQIPQLIKLSATEPFGKYKDHDDEELETRKAICEVLTARNSNNGGHGCCDGCPGAERPISNKKPEMQENGKECTDTSWRTGYFCATLCQYKDMFQVEVDNVKNKSEISNVDEDEKIYIFSQLSNFLDLQLSTEEISSEIVLPYSPAWIFLATVKLLEEKLPENECRLTQDNGQNKWKLSVEFTSSGRKHSESQDKKNNATNLRDRIMNHLKNDDYAGDVTTAVVNVLLGRIPGLNNPLFTGPVAKQLEKGLLTKNTYEKYLGYEVSPSDEKIKIIFTWPGQAI